MSGRRQYSSGVLDGNWNEDCFDAKYTATRPRLTSNLENEWTTLYRADFDRTSQGGSVFRPGSDALMATRAGRVADPQRIPNVKAFPGHQPELDLREQRCQYSQFETTTSAAFKNPGEQQGESKAGTEQGVRPLRTACGLAPPPQWSEEALEEHRRRWTQSGPVTRKLISQSESHRNQLSGNPASSSMAPSSPSGGADSTITARAALPRVQALLHRVREAIRQNGITAIADLEVAFHRMDLDHSGKLCFDEFVQGLESYGVKFTNLEFSILMRAFDSDGDGELSMEEFLAQLRGLMSNRRLEAVKEAFRLLDSRGTGVVELEEIVDAFNALGHPDVKTKKKSAHQAMREFGDALKVVCPDGKVTLEGFSRYFGDVSAAIPREDSFLLLVKNAFRSTTDGTPCASNASQGQSSTEDSRPTMEVPQLLEHIRQVMKDRGLTGIAELGRSFRIMDDDSSHCLNVEEFFTGLKDYGVVLRKQELDSLRSYFDTNGDGSIDYDEFLYHLRGPLSETRIRAIEDAFRRLDANGNGVVELDDIFANYNARDHPEVRSGKKTEQQVLRDFLDTFDGGVKDGVVHLDEFIRYYADVSASIDTDEYFVAMMDSAWKRKPQGGRR